LREPEGKRPRVSYPEYLHGFWDALARAEEKDGCIVLPAPYKWDRASGDKIFVRKCYKALADAILRDAGLLDPLPESPESTPGVIRYSSKCCWTILGNPGA